MIRNLEDRAIRRTPAAPAAPEHPRERSAAELVEALERLDLGVPIDRLEETERAADAARRRALGDLCLNAIAPAAGDVFAAYEFYTGRLPPADFGAGLVALHGRCLPTWPTLAALIRQEGALEVEGHARVRASTMAPRPRETAEAMGSSYAAVAVAGFQRALAEQLVAAGHELAPHARALLEAEALLERVAAARTRHEAHARQLAEEAEAARMAAELEADEAAAEARRAAEAQRVAVEAAYVRAQEAARVAAAEDLARRIRRSGVEALKGRGPGRTFGAAEIAAQARAMSMSQITEYTALLDATLAEGRS